MKKIILPLLAAFALSSCSTFGPGKSNLEAPTPLKAFYPTKPLWVDNTGSGASGQHLTLTPTLVGHLIYTSSYRGKIVGIDDQTGKVMRTVNTHQRLTTPVIAGDGSLFVGATARNFAGNSQPELLQLCEASTKEIREIPLSAETVTAPLVTQGMVIVKTANDGLEAFDTSTGQPTWSFENPNKPETILRKQSAPIVGPNGDIYAGFASGSVMKFSPTTGQTLAGPYMLAIPQGTSAVQRMVDVASTPAIINNTLMIGTYQGNLAAIPLNNFTSSWQSSFPKTQWERAFSMTRDIVPGPAGSHSMFVADNDSNIYKVDTKTGATIWESDGLRYRDISDMAYANGHVVVGDAEGYVHLLSASTGQMTTLAKVDSGISAAPLVINGEIFIYSNDGNLYAYKLTGLQEETSAPVMPAKKTVPQKAARLPSTGYPIT